MAVSRNKTALFVISPEHRVVTRSMLPKEAPKRWSTQYKRNLIDLIKGGLVTESEMRKKYGLSPLQIESWREAIGERRKQQEGIIRLSSGIGDCE